MRQLPQVAVAFERFLALRGQSGINGLLAAREALPGPALLSKRNRAGRSGATPARPVRSSGADADRRG